MKSKSSLYYLVPAVVVVWLVIGIQVFKYAKGSGHINVAAPVLNIPKNTKTEVDEKYELLLNYTDPFTQRKPVKKVSASLPAISSVVKKESVKSNVTENISINVKNINYFGFMEKPNSEKRALVSVNRQQFIVKKGDVVNEYVIGDIHDDSLKVSVGKQVVFIHKTH